MTTETKQCMTVAEIALMREIVRWRKNHDIDFVRRAVYGAPYWKDYRTGREVWFQRNQEHPMSLVADRAAWPATAPADSLAQAVDLLVAYGYLPQRFSSAYRAGWDALLANQRETFPLRADDERAIRRNARRPAVKP